MVEKYLLNSLLLYLVVELLQLAHENFINGNLTEKNNPFYGKSMGTDFPGLSHSMGFADFSNAMGNLIKEPMLFPCDEVYHRMLI